MIDRSPRPLSRPTIRQRPQRPISSRDRRAPTHSRQGLTRLEVEALRVKQGNRCAVGGEPLPPRFTVDHDHQLALKHPHPVTTGCKHCVRGLVCNAHNTALGVFGDDPDALRRAAEYVSWRRKRATP